MRKPEDKDNEMMTRVMREKNENENEEIAEWTIRSVT